MSKRGEQNLAGLLGLLLQGGSYYMQRKDRQEREAEDEKLREQERADYKAETEAADARYRGQRERVLEEKGWERRPTLTGSYADSAKLASMVSKTDSIPPPSPAFVGPQPAAIDYGQYYSDLGSSWKAPVEPSAEDQAMGQADILLKVIAKMQEGAPEGMNWTGTSYQYPPRQPAGGGAVDTGPSTRDELNVQQLATRDAERWARVNGRVAEGINGPGEVIWDADVNAIYEWALRKYHGGTVPEDGAGELSTGGTLIEFAQAYAAQDPEALADFAEADSMTQAVVALLSQNLPSLAGGQAEPGAPLTRGSDLSGLLETIAGEATQAGELMTGKMSEIADLDTEELKWQGVLAQVAGEPYSGARVQREEQIRRILSEIAAEQQRRLVEARTMGVQNRRPTPLGGMGGLGSLR